MNDKQLRALSVRGTDIDGALNRMGGNEQLYLTLLQMFLDDPSVERLNCAVEEKSWDDAFTAAHALKGLAGNMGFVPLMHSTGQLVVMIRGGRFKGIDDYLAQVNSDWRDITDAIRDHFVPAI